MKFGTTMEQDRQQREGRESGSGRWIKNLKKGETRIFFLEEMNSWTPYWEHFHQEMQKSFPCTGDKNTCPGCTSDNERTAKASKRYLVNALVGDYVDLYKIPVSMISKLDRRADQDEGSLMRRWYLVFKSGTGLQVEYDVDRDEPDRIDVDGLREKFQDHQEALANAYIEVWGSLPDETSEAEQPQDKPAPRRRARSADEVEGRTEKSEAAKLVDQARKNSSKPVEDDPPSEPQTQSEPGAEEEDGEILSEDEVRQMEVPALLDLYQRCGITPPDSSNQKVLAEELIRILAE